MYANVGWQILIIIIIIIIKTQNIKLPIKKFHKTVIVGIVGKYK